MGMQIPCKVTAPIRNDSRPKLDESNELEQSEMTMYQYLIWEIRW